MGLDICVWTQPTPPRLQSYRFSCIITSCTFSSAPLHLEPVSINQARELACTPSYLHTYSERSLPLALTFPPIHHPYVLQRTSHRKSHPPLLFPSANHQRRKHTSEKYFLHSLPKVMCCSTGSKHCDASPPAIFSFLKDS